MIRTVKVVISSIPKPTHTYAGCVVLAGQYHPQGLAAWCRPEHVVISGARDFELGRDPEVVARAFYAAGAWVYHTAEHGAVRFVLSQENVIASTMRHPRPDSHNSVYDDATNAIQ